MTVQHKRKGVMTTRRDFIIRSSSLAAAAVCGAAGCATAAVKKTPFGGYGWGALLHLGSNMWDDFPGDPDSLPTTPEGEKTLPLGPSGKPIRYHNYLRCRDDLWRRSVDRLVARKMDHVFIDLGEGVRYPSHPELSVPGSWSVEKLRDELARIRAAGIEPFPKLNFSSCHDAWLKNYHRMLSTRKYYQVVADLVRDVAEMFDTPRLFHIGYDEEMAIAQFNHYHVTVRQKELWWHDLNYTVDQVSRCGCRPVMWADAIWTGRAEFVRRMSKEILQANWYYRSDFSPKKLTWNAEFEKEGGWGETVNGAAAFMELEKAGFDQLPCTSNWAEDASAEAVVDYCLKNIDPSRLKGICTAPWAMTVPDTAEKKNITKALEGIDLLAAARDKHGL